MSITTIVGPMFSGKTSELFRLAGRHVLSNEDVVMFKYAKDKRYRKRLASSHDRITFKAIPVTSFNGVIPCEIHGSVICIDEGQFIDGLVEFCDKMANQGKHVYVAGLNSTFERKPFDKMSKLMACAEESIHLSAICALCHKEAQFTRRISNSTALEEIGGAESYIPCCRKCWQKEIDPKVIECNKQNIEKLYELKNSTDSE
jgi:thymidine kinase